MFDKVITKLQTMSEEAVFDPSCFEDDIAMRTKWTPRRNGGSKIQTHTLVEVNSQRVEFRGTASLVKMFVIYILIALVFPFLLSLPMLLEQEGFSLVFLFPLGICFIFVLLGFIGFRSALKPLVFDKNLGYYWKGRVTPTPYGDMAKIKEYCKLSEIYAIQIISEYCRGASSHSRQAPYYSYEINLVLKDASRLNVTDHGSKKHIRLDADKLAKFLKVPLWDAS